MVGMTTDENTVKVISPVKKLSIQRKESHKKTSKECKQGHLKIESAFRDIVGEPQNLLKESTDILNRPFHFLALVRGN